MSNQETKLRVRITKDGREPRCVELLYENGDVKEMFYRSDGLITEPCNPRCEGMVSYCCQLRQEEVTEDGWTAQEIFDYYADLIDDLNQKEWLGQR